LLSIEFLASSPRTDIDNTSFRVFLLQSFLKALIFFFHPFFLKQKVPPPLLTVIASGEEGKAMVARESQSSMPIQSFAAVVGILTNNCYLLTRITLGNRSLHVGFFFFHPFVLKQKVEPKIQGRFKTVLILGHRSLL
jgi:hypothetical protein